MLSKKYPTVLVIPTAPPPLSFLTTHKPYLIIEKLPGRAPHSWFKYSVLALRTECSLRSQIWTWSPHGTQLSPWHLLCWHPQALSGFVSLVWFLRIRRISRRLPYLDPLPFMGKKNLRGNPRMAVFTFSTFKSLISEENVEIGGPPVKSTRPWKKRKLWLHAELLSPSPGSPPKLLAAPWGRTTLKSLEKEQEGLNRKKRGVGKAQVHPHNGSRLLPAAYLLEQVLVQKGTIPTVTEGTFRDLELEQV